MRANRCQCVPSTLQQHLSSRAQLRYRACIFCFLDLSMIGTFLYRQQGGWECECAQERRCVKTRGQPIERATSKVVIEQLNHKMHEVNIRTKFLKFTAFESSISLHDVSKSVEFYKEGEFRRANSVLSKDDHLP